MCCSENLDTMRREYSTPGCHVDDSLGSTFGCFDDVNAVGEERTKTERHVMYTMLHVLRLRLRGSSGVEFRERRTGPGSRVGVRAGSCCALR